ncbi:zinc finger protein 36 family 3 protein, partial [Cystoisospora suis]
MSITRRPPHLSQRRNLDFSLEEEKALRLHEERERENKDGETRPRALSRLSVPWQDSEDVFPSHRRTREEREIEGTRRRSVSVGEGIQEGSRAYDALRKKFVGSSFPPSMLTGTENMRGREEEEEGEALGGGGGGHEGGLSSYSLVHFRPKQERERFFEEKTSLFSPNGEYEEEIEDIDTREVVSDGGGSARTAGDKRKRRGRDEEGWAYRLSSSIFPLFRYRRNVAHHTISFSTKAVASSSSSCHHTADFTPLSQLDIRGGGGEQDKADSLSSSLAGVDNGEDSNKDEAAKGKSVLFPVARQHLRLFIVSYICYAVLYSTRKPFSVVKEDVHRGLGLSTYTLGCIDTSFLSLYAIGQFVLPPVLSNLRLSVGLSACYIISAVATLAFGISSSSLALIAWWGINGLSHAAVFPLLVKALTQRLTQAERGRAMGLWTTSQQTGAMLSTAFAAFIAAHLGWRAVFLLSAVVCGLSTIGLIFFLPSSSSVHARIHPGEEDRDGRSLLKSGRSCLSLPSSSRRKERRQGFSKLDSSSHGDELSTDEDEEGDLSHATRLQEKKPWTSTEKEDKKRLRDKKDVIAWQQQGSGDGGGGPEAGGGRGEVEMKIERGNQRREDDKKIFSSSPVSLTHSSSGETHVTDDGDDVDEQEEDSRKKISSSSSVHGRNGGLSPAKRGEIPSSSSSPSVRVYNISSDVSTCKAIKTATSTRTPLDETRRDIERENEREATSSPSFFFDEDDDDLFFSDHRLSSSIQKLQEREASGQDSLSLMKDSDPMKQENSTAAIPPIYTTPTPPTSSSSLNVSPPSLFLSSSSQHQACNPLKSSSSSSLSTSSYPVPLSLSSSLPDHKGQAIPFHSSSPPAFPCQEQHTPKAESSLSIPTSTGILHDRPLGEKNKKENRSPYSPCSSSAYMTRSGMIRSEGGRREKGEGRSSTRGRLRGIAQAMILVWRLPFVLSCSLGYFLIKLIRYSLLFWLPFFLAKEAHLHASTAGYASMIFDIGGIGGAVFGGFLADRVMKGRRLTCAATMSLLTGFSLLLLAFSCQQQQNLLHRMEEDEALGRHALQRLIETHQTSMNELQEQHRRARLQLPLHVQQYFEKEDLKRQEEEKQREEEEKRKKKIEEKKEHDDDQEEMKKEKKISEGEHPSEVDNDHEPLDVKKTKEEEKRKEDGEENPINRSSSLSSSSKEEKKEETSKVELPISDKESKSPQSFSGEKRENVSESSTPQPEGGVQKSNPGKISASSSASSVSSPPSANQQEDTAGATTATAASSSSLPSSTLPQESSSSPSLRSHDETGGDPGISAGDNRRTEGERGVGGIEEVQGGASIPVVVAPSSPSLQQQQDDAAPQLPAVVGGGQGGEVPQQPVLTPSISPGYLQQQANVPPQGGNMGGPPPPSLYSSPSYPLPQGGAGNTGLVGSQMASPLLQGEPQSLPSSLQVPAVAPQQIQAIPQLSPPPNGMAPSLPSPSAPVPPSPLQQQQEYIGGPASVAGSTGISAPPSMPALGGAPSSPSLPYQASSLPSSAVPIVSPSPPLPSPVPSPPINALNTNQQQSPPLQQPYVPPAPPSAAVAVLGDASPRVSPLSPPPVPSQPLSPSPPTPPLLAPPPPLQQQGLVPSSVSSGAPMAEPQLGPSKSGSAAVPTPAVKSSATGGKPAAGGAMVDDGKEGISKTPPSLSSSSTTDHAAINGSSVPAGGLPGWTGRSQIARQSSAGSATGTPVEATAGDTGSRVQGDVKVEQRSQGGVSSSQQPNQYSIDRQPGQGIGRDGGIASQQPTSAPGGPAQVPLGYPEQGLLANPQVSPSPFPTHSPALSVQMPPMQPVPPSSSQASAVPSYHPLAPPQVPSPYAPSQPSMVSSQVSPPVQPKPVILQQPVASSFSSLQPQLAPPQAAPPSPLSPPPIQPPVTAPQAPSLNQAQMPLSQASLPPPPPVPVQPSFTPQLQSYDLSLQSQMTSSQAPLPSPPLLVPAQLPPTPQPSPYPLQPQTPSSSSLPLPTQAVATQQQVPPFSSPSPLIPQVPSYPTQTPGNPQLSPHAPVVHPQQTPPTQPPVTPPLPPPSVPSLPGQVSPSLS